MVLEMDQELVLESVLVWVLVWDQVFRPLALQSGQELEL